MQFITTHRLKTGAAGSLATLALALAPAAPAMAQNALRGYEDDAAAVQNQIEESPSTENTPASTDKPSTQTRATPSNNDSLPFTGFDTSVILALGLALAGLGFGLRRIARPTA